MNERTTGDFHEDIERVLVSSLEIATRVVELAQQVGNDYAHADGRLTVVPVMTGSLLFAADFVRALPQRRGICAPARCASRRLGFP